MTIDRFPKMKHSTAFCCIKEKQIAMAGPLHAGPACLGLKHDVDRLVTGDARSRTRCADCSGTIPWPMPGRCKRPSAAPSLDRSLGTESALRAPYMVRDPEGTRNWRWQRGVPVP